MWCCAKPLLGSSGRDEISEISCEATTFPGIKVTGLPYGGLFKQSPFGKTSGKAIKRSNFSTKRPYIHVKNYVRSHAVYIKHLNSVVKIGFIIVRM